ncbi:hypothetical protein Rhe02_78430 [Rhizocola hellebori]|uniref:Uncharacterized protein n=2 Tax=Rhizocola hellebori TaxID=1392758 RepID=A0A8J3VL99_9ACTN|nr:hypothetical protein Rhe02_78430 [Rhizocola hellebori]
MPSVADESLPGERDQARRMALGRVQESFRDVYLTLISIIQGVALGYLIQTIGATYKEIDVDRAGRVVVVLVGIAVIWQEYLVGLMMFAWVPTVIDACRRSPFSPPRSSSNGTGVGLGHSSTWWVGWLSSRSVLVVCWAGSWGRS